MKLSDLGKQIRLPGLEAQFGERWQEYALHREKPVTRRTRERLPPRRNRSRDGPER